MARVPGVGASGKTRGRSASGGNDRDRQPGGRRAEDVDRVGWPAADEQVGQVHDVVGVEVGEEHRPHAAGRRRS